MILIKATFAKDGATTKFRKEAIRSNINISNGSTFMLFVHDKAALHDTLAPSLGKSENTFRKGET